MSDKSHREEGETVRKRNVTEVNAGQKNKQLNSHMHRQSTATKKHTSPTSHTSNKFSHQAFLKKWKPGKSRNQVMTSRKASQESFVEKRKGRLSADKQGESNNNTTTSDKAEEEIIFIDDSSSSDESKDSHLKQNSTTEHVPCDKSVDINSENTPSRNKSGKSMLPDSVEPGLAVEENGKTEKSLPQTSVADKANIDASDKECSTSDANAVAESNGKNQEVVKVKAGGDDSLPTRKRRGNPKDKVEKSSARSSRSRSKSSEGQTAQDSVCSSTDDKHGVIIIDESTETKDESKPSSGASASSTKLDKKKDDQDNNKPDAEKTKSAGNEDSVGTKKFPVVVLGPIEDSEWQLLSGSKKRQSVSDPKPDKKTEKDTSTTSTETNSGLSTRTPRRKVAKRAYSPSDDSFSKPAAVVIKTEPGLSEPPTPPTMVSATPPSGKRSKNYCLESVVKPFLIGWMREVVHRATGKGVDIYYFTPEGKKLRSMNDVSKYLSEHKKSGLTSDNFTFTKDSIYREPFEKVRGARIRAADGVETPPVVKIEPPDTPAKSAPKKSPSSAAKGGKQKEESQSSSELKKTKGEGSSSKGKKPLKGTPKIKLFPGLLRRPSKLKLSSPDKSSNVSLSEDVPLSTKAEKDSPLPPAESTVTSAKSTATSKSVANTPSSKNSAGSAKTVLETPISDKPTDAKDAATKKDDVVQLGQVSSTSNEKRARKTPRRFIEEREKSPLQKKARIKYTEVKKTTPMGSI